NPTVAICVITIVMVQSAHATPEPARWPSTQRVRAAAGKKSASTYDQAARLGGLTQSPTIPCIDPDAEPGDHRCECRKANACCYPEDCSGAGRRLRSDQSVFIPFG